MAGNVYLTNAEAEVVRAHLFMLYNHGRTSLSRDPHDVPMEAREKGLTEKKVVGNIMEKVDKIMD